MRHELADIDVAVCRGLEIGPLSAPVVAKHDGEVYYVDHADRKELQAKYANDPYMGTRLEEIEEVDYVLKPGQSLSDATGADAPFDYVIASHLIEHIPDMAGWLHDVASLLRTGGVLSLVVPDKRYSFDINRSVTEISDIVDAHLRRLDRPSYGQAFDFFARALNGVVDRAQVWAGTADYSRMVRQDCDDPFVTAYDWCQAVLSSDQFVDVHCHVFTPSSFLEILEKLARLGLLDYEVSSFFPTEYDTLEFHISLRKLDPTFSGDDRRTRQLSSVEAARDIVAADETAHLSRRTATSLPPIQMEVSGLERRLITLKRTGMGGIRAAKRRLQRR